MIRSIFLYAVVLVFYGIAFAMIFRVFLVALTFRSSVPFVPSSGKVIKKVLEIFKLRRGDKVIDIGSGDGRFIIKAARIYPGVKFHGVEQNGFLVWLSKLKASFYRLENVEFFHMNAEDHDFKGYTKVYMYMPDFFAGSVLDTVENMLPKGAMVTNAVFGFGQKFEKDHKIETVTFTNLGKRSKISLWNK